MTIPVIVVKIIIYSHCPSFNCKFVSIIFSPEEYLIDCFVYFEFKWVNQTTYMLGVVLSSLFTISGSVYYFIEKSKGKVYLPKASN